jgi:hypothetical protein
LAACPPYGGRCGYKSHVSQPFGISEYMDSMTDFKGIQLDLFEDRKMSKKSDLLKASKREKTFSTLAHKEALGADRRSKNTTGANKADNRMESRLDEVFAKKRAKIATALKKKAYKDE